jgi:hypothetical protein
MTSLKEIQDDLRKLTWVINVIDGITSHHDIEGFDEVTIDGKEVQVSSLIAHNRNRIKAMTDTKTSTRKMDRSYQDAMSKALAFEEFKVEV